MTLVSDIINDAYRESNIIALGTPPSGAQSQEALTALNRFVKSVYDRELGERLKPINVGTNNVAKKDGLPDYSIALAQSYVPENSRLILNLTAAQTIYLPPAPYDGSRFGFIDKSGNLSMKTFTVNANGRTIENATSLNYTTNSVNTEYVYDAAAGDWRKLSPLVTSDTWPFPTEFDDLFIISLSMRLNPRYQQQVDEQSQLAYKRSMTAFKSRYRQSKEMASELGIVALPSTAVVTGLSPLFNVFNTG